jgi:hypothetical protein
MFGAGAHPMRALWRRGSSAAKRAPRDPSRTRATREQRRIGSWRSRPHGSSPRPPPVPKGGGPPGPRSSPSATRDHRCRTPLWTIVLALGPDCNPAGHAPRGAPALPAWRPRVARRALCRTDALSLRPRQRPGARRRKPPSVWPRHRRGGTVSWLTTNPFRMGYWCDERSDAFVRPVG